MLEIKVVSHREIFDDPGRADELARFFANGGEGGVDLAYKLANRYMLLAIQTILEHGSLARSRKYEAISENLVRAGDKAYTLLQILDPQSDSHILSERNLGPLL